jgi:hypothetical protein
MRRTLPGPAAPAAFAVLALTVACGGGGAPALHDGPRLVAQDSVLIVDADTLYLGNPYALVVDPLDGSFYVSDFFVNRVFRFGRDGAVIRTYGRAGSGPGEFRVPTLVSPVDSTLVIAADNGRHLMHLFDRNTGEHRRSVSYRGRLGSTAPVRLGSTLWMPSRSLQDATTALAWDLETDSIRYLGPLPAEYQASLRSIGRYAGFFTMGVLTAWEDTVLVGMGGRNELVLIDHHGTVLDTLRPPVSRRRGVPHNVQQLFDEQRLPRRELFRRVSATRHLHRRSDGSFVIVHHDSEQESDDAFSVITARALVTVVSPDRRRACVDAHLPVSPDARPIHGARGDTLFLLDRRIVGERMETWIVPYLVDTVGCDWIDIR